MKQFFKKLFKRYYHSFVTHLRNDLNTKEHENLMHHIIAQNVQLDKKLDHLEQYLYNVTALIGALDRPEGSGTQGQNTTEIIQDIVQIFAHKPTDIAVVQMMQTIKREYITGKRVCVVGSNNYLFTEELKKKDPTYLVSLEMNPFLMKDHTTGGKQGSDEIIYVYPTKIATVAIPECDVLFCPHPALNAYLLKHNLFHLGAKTKELAIVMIQGNKEIREKLLTGLHKGGFAEAKEMNTGETSQFDYEKNSAPEPNKEDTGDKVEKPMIYLAHKLPQVDTQE